MKWLEIGPAIVGVIVSFVILWRQEKTNREMERLRHDLSKERFYMEKWWDERRLLYLKISKVIQDMSESMWGISVELGKKMFNLREILTLYYIDNVFLTEADGHFWFIIREEYATEEEKLGINSIKIRENLHVLINETLLEMRGDIKLLGTREFIEIFDELMEIASDFLEESRWIVYLLIRKTESMGLEETEAESMAKQRFSQHLSKTLKDLGQLNLTSKWNDFSNKFRQLVTQMRKDLGDTHPANS